MLRAGLKIFIKIVLFISLILLLIIVLNGYGALHYPF